MLFKVCFGWNLKMLTWELLWHVVCDHRFSIRNWIFDINLSFPEALSSSIEISSGYPSYSPSVQCLFGRCLLNFILLAPLFPVWKRDYHPLPADCSYPAIQAPPHRQTTTSISVFLVKPAVNSHPVAPEFTARRDYFNLIFLPYSIGYGGLWI